MPKGFRRTAISALEGGVLAALAAAALKARLEPAAWSRALVGLAAAWVASTASVALLIAAQAGAPRDFMRAFGAGVMLRGLVLAALMAGAMGDGWDLQAPLLGAYALGVLGLLLVEYRQLMVKTK
ncbi:MAG: hypothetical protein HYZ75_05330 [Elusimicrobia bacterium]|nr:hypothetical protein [Elusimicrobiota bacterium]